MRASGLALWGSFSALALTFSAGGCGGRTANFEPVDGGDDGVSSGSSSGLSGSSGGVSGSSSGISGSSAGSSSGSSSSSGGPFGSIVLEECVNSLCASQNVDAFTVIAIFGSCIGSCGCTTTTTGACTHYSCSLTGTGTTGTLVSAGTLTVSGPSLMPPLSMPPMSANSGSAYVYTYSSSTPGFKAGQTLTVSASGASVPAFGPVSVGAPYLTVLVQPPVTTGSGTTTISTASDLPVRWIGGQPGATMQVEALTDYTGQSYTLCTWNASDGNGVIPAAALKPFSGKSGFLYYGQYDLTSFSSGPYAITITAIDVAPGAVNFQ